MKKTALTCLFLLALIRPSLATDDKIIELQDGSKIKGRIVSMENGSYVVQTASMGELHIPDSNIASMSAETTAPVTSNITATPEFQAIQTQIMSNPDVMRDIQKLIQDPDVMAVMSDPGFIAAVQSGNTASLQSDPRLKHLSDNPHIQALIHKIKSQQ